MPRAGVTAHRLALRAGYPLLRAYRRTFRPPATGVKCVVARGDEVVLVRHTYGPRRRWDLPGGGVRRGEAPVEAAQRETREEVGVVAAGWRPLGTLRFRRNPRHVLHGFAANVEAADLTRDPAEIAEARWFPRGALPAPVAPWVRTFVRGHDSPRT